MVHPLLPQVHDVDQWKKWSVHDRQRQHDLPHSEPRVSLPEGSTCPFIKYSIGWGKSLFFLILIFLLDCYLLCHACFSCRFLLNPIRWPVYLSTAIACPLHLQTCTLVQWTCTFNIPIMPLLLLSLTDNWHQLPNLGRKNGMFQSDGGACQRRLTGKWSSKSWRNS